MKLGIALLLAGATCFGHRLDEYLQAAMLSVEKDRVQIQLRLTPGVAVFNAVIADIDTDHDGTISATEQRAYAERVLADLSLSMDGDRIAPKLSAASFPSIEKMQEGLGEIQLDITADLPPTAGDRKIVFENRHHKAISAYLVNCLAPHDADLRIEHQARNYEQSRYELAYRQAGSTHASGLFLAALAGAALAARLLFNASSRRPRSSSPGASLPMTSAPDTQDHPQIPSHRPCPD